MARFIEKKRRLGKTKKKPKKTIIDLINYNKKTVDERDIKDIKDGHIFRNAKSVTWININGVHDSELIAGVGETMDLHSLLIEDISITGQRPKISENEDNIFLIVKMVRFDVAKKRVVSEQLSMVIADNFLITFQEKKGDVFEPVRERIRNGKGRIRTGGADYLAYALLDTVVDNYIFTVEKIGEQIEDLEEEIIGSQKPAVVDKINTYKREMNYLRKSIRPAREAIMKLSRLESEIIGENARPYIKDLEDLISQATEAIDTYREMLSDQLNIYHTNLSNRMNEIMKVLTVFTAVFIPLTFVTGVYGTNFKYFPELSYKYSYYAFWLVLLVITFFMLRFFKNKKWF